MVRELTTNQFLRAARTLWNFLSDNSEKTLTYIVLKVCSKSL